jgi:hypothetical protein
LCHEFNFHFLIYSPTELKKGEPSCLLTILQPDQRMSKSRLVVILIVNHKWVEAVDYGICVSFFSSVIAPRDVREVYPFYSKFTHMCMSTIYSVCCVAMMLFYYSFTYGITLLLVILFVYSLSLILFSRVSFAFLLWIHIQNYFSTCEELCVVDLPMWGKTRNK